jgi:hypothetical protein
MAAVFNRGRMSQTAVALKRTCMSNPRITLKQGVLENASQFLRGVLCYQESATAAWRFKDTFKRSSLLKGARRQL